MNKRNKQLQKILGLCLEINPTATQKEKTGDKPTVFFHFSGHVGYVEINIYPTGWFSTQDNDYAYQAYNMRDWVKRIIATGEEKRVTVGQVVADLQRIKQEVSEHA